MAVDPAKLCLRHFARDCVCARPLPPDAPRDPRPWWRRFLMALRMPYYSPGRGYRWRRPFGFWSLVQMLDREGPRPRTFGRWWATWRGDAARRRESRRIKAMPKGPERDEAFRLFALGQVRAARGNIEGALESPCP